MTPVTDLLCEIATGEQNANTLNKLARIFQKGKVSQRDATRAAHMFSLTAKRGCAAAHINLGKYFETRTALRRTVRAMELYTLAVKRGLSVD